jgi:hypothetical protein
VTRPVLKIVVIVAVVLAIFLVDRRPDRLTRNVGAPAKIVDGLTIAALLYFAVVATRATARRIRSRSATPHKDAATLEESAEILASATARPTSTERTTSNEGATPAGRHERAAAWQIALATIVAYLVGVALTAPMGLAVFLVAPGFLVEEYFGRDQGDGLSPLGIGSSALFFAAIAVLYRRRRWLAVGLGLAAMAGGLATAFGRGLRNLGGP